MTETNDATTTEESTGSTDARVAPDVGGDDFELRETLYKGALGLFTLLAVVAVLQLYLSMGSVINTFISREYRPLYRVAFNLVVLLAAGIGISWTVRQLSGE